MLEIIGLPSRCALLSIIKPLKRNFWFVGTTIFPLFWSMTGSDSFPFLSVHLIHLIYHISDSGWIWNAFALPCQGDHFGSWWSILVHFGTHHGWPHHPSMTGSDSYPLSSAHFIQKRVILVTQENSKHFCTAMLYWPFGSILVHFGLFWCTSWVTPPPLHDWFWLLSPF